MKYSFVVLIFISLSGRAVAQYTLSTETIISKSKELLELQRQRLYSPAGQNGRTLVYQLNRKSTGKAHRSAEGIKKVYYDELTRTITDSIVVQKKSNKILRFIQLNDLLVFRGFYDVPENRQTKTIDELNRGEFLLNSQDIWVESGGKEVKIKSYPEHYYDKDVYFQIGASGKYVIVNTYVSQYLRSSESDSVISILDVKGGSIKNFNCKNCISPHVVGEYLYYGKKFFYLKGADVYDWKIFRAPLSNISKSELLGEFVELLFVTPDASFIVGKKLLYGEETLIVLDVKAGKFQYLLGRDYSKLKFFLSPSYQKIAFDRHTDILYVEYPKIYPFSAIGVEAKPQQIPEQESIKFWQKFIHPQ
jgi:hypothetical protein